MIKDRVRPFRFNKIPTLREVWADYQYYKHLSGLTLKNYNSRLENHLPDWLDLPVRNITSAMIEQRHAAIISKSSADATMRLLRALLQHVQDRYEQVGKVLFLRQLPTKILNKSRKWHVGKACTICISREQRLVLIEALRNKELSVAGEAVLFALFTGLRKAQVLNLRWRDINSTSESVNLNGSTIPLSKQSMQILSRLRQRTSYSAFVFANAAGTKPIVTLDKTIALISRSSGVRFCLDDLRRTFRQVADEVDVSRSVLRELLALSRQPGDCEHSLERLRFSAQKICDALEAK
ncbi:MAG: hypothetical protein U0103_23115 [Candidatus Obscuribacterales bacterium]